MENPINLTITKTNTITSFEIHQMNVLLNTSAELYVCLKNADNNIVVNEYIKIEGADYDNWLNDDQYIIDFVKNYILQKYNGSNS